MYQATNVLTAVIHRHMGRLGDESLDALKLVSTPIAWLVKRVPLTIDRALLEGGYDVFNFYRKPTINL
jgi:hypothetical protein